MLATPAPAQTYPSRPVRLVVPFPPGGTADVFGRLLAQQLTQSLGQPFVVDNRAGAGGNIAAGAVANAAADGYTVLLGTIGTHGINPSLYGNLPYSPRKDFQPVALVFRRQRTRCPSRRASPYGQGANCAGKKPAWPVDDGLVGQWQQHSYVR